MLYGRVPCNFAVVRHVADPEKIENIRTSVENDSRRDSLTCQNVLISIFLLPSSPSVGLIVNNNIIICTRTRL